jgi:hypothetical protein
MTPQLMFDLRKLFIREARGRRNVDPDSDYHPSDRKGVGLEVEYQSLIATQFRRWGISNNCVTIEVRQIGRAPDGFEVFVGMVRLAQWERESALRVLLGLPLLETKVRKTVRGTWLADFSHFGGLWLHASEQLHNSPAIGDLRNLMLQLVPPAQPAAAGQTTDYGVSSLPGPTTGHEASQLSQLSPSASSMDPAASVSPVEVGESGFRRE